MARRKNLRGREVERTSRVQETSNIDVISLTRITMESNTALPLVAAIIIHGQAIVDETTGSVARIEDKDDRIHGGTLITSIKDNNLVLTLIGIPHTLGAVLVSVTLDLSCREATSITFIKSIQFNWNTIVARCANSASKSNYCEKAQRCNNNLAHPIYNKYTKKI